MIMIIPKMVHPRRMPRPKPMMIDIAVCLLEQVERRVGDDEGDVHDEQGREAEDEDVHTNLLGGASPH